MVGFQFIQDNLEARFQVLAQAHGVSPGDNVANTIVENVLEHDRGSRLAVADCHVQSPQHLAEVHSPHVGIAINELDDAPGDNRAIVQ